MSNKFENMSNNDSREFLENLLEAIPNVYSSEDVGNTIEYFDEYGSTLFCVDIISDREYLFRFYDASFSVSEEDMKGISEILKPKTAATTAV